MTGKNPDLLSAVEVCEMLKISNGTLYRHISAGIVPKPIKIKRLARWRLSEIEKLLDNLTEQRATTIPEGHFTITRTMDNHDCDHGPCVGHFVKELGLWVYLYANDATRISFHVEPEES